MRRSLIVSCAVLSLSACSKPPPPTIEETVLIESMAALQAGDAYDEICNNRDPKDKFDFTNSENAIRAGNEQMLAARIGGLTMLRNDKLTVDESVKRLVEVSKKFNEKAKEVLKAKGCDSPEAKSSESAFNLFRTANMISLMQVIDKRIVQNGGTVTSHETFDKLDAFRKAK